MGKVSFSQAAAETAKKGIDKIQNDGIIILAISCSMPHACSTLKVRRERMSGVVAENHEI